MGGTLFNAYVNKYINNIKFKHLQIFEDYLFSVLEFGPSYSQNI